jgi:hypothetical protein
MRSEKSSELNTSEKFASLQEEVTNIAKARKIFTLQMMRRSIFSSLTEACTLQSHCKCPIDNDDLRNLLTNASWNPIDRH